jgi:hypothetical protein
MIPSEIRYIHERAKAYQMIEDHENAVRDFNMVIKRNPKNAHAHFRRAFSHKSIAQQMDLELSELHEFGKLISVTNRKPEEE